MDSQKNGVHFNGKSWGHNIKILDEYGNVSYSKRSGFQTPEEALRSAAAYKEKFQEDLKSYQLRNKIDINMTLKDYLEYWFEEVFSKRVESTTEMVGRYTLYYLVIPHIERNIKLRYANVEYYNQLLENVSRICPSAGNKSREYLNIAMKDAIVAGYINYNPIQQTKKYPREKPSITILSKSQIKILLEAAQGNPWYLEILLGMFCGLRKGEILGLKFEDFDLENETVSISRQLGTNHEFKNPDSVVGRQICIEKPPKSEKSYRTLKVPKIILHELEVRRLKIQADKKRMKDKYVDNDYVCCREDGLYQSQSAMNNALNKLCDRNGLPRITVHSLRHIFATILIEKKVPLIKVSALMGHESIHTTFEIYCDMIDDGNNIKEFMNNTFIPSINEVREDDRSEAAGIHRVEGW
ncbi:MAG: site-specific integrase [Anaerotignum sp.]|nr:site-specific integrase [Anaerotignum sp.]